ncbi:NUDIX hydrolase [Bacillus suaedaesalsae]|uniref:8-oxo-dGTP diphosphatase n=1 Tax=Bacillus suaedaesalsae TaxID=2810349 RepID=A0ABS2DMZ1_9BACI|nr:8-oxo-dGTP diphosphatase [Bacillus suaedaesalsae]MBM6618851.1 8-oxo-dGTP diphosphatase [Bacillus suaedaesalsae]
MQINYTICFIKKNNQLLMLYRTKNPNQHKWNGVGGKIEKGEDIRLSIIRETLEETGLSIRNPIYKGIVSWNQSGGMHVFFATQFSGELSASVEGPLEWKEISWVKNSNDVVSNIPIFIDHILSSDGPVEYSFQYDEKGNIVSHKVLKLYETLANL